MSTRTEIRQAVSNGDIELALKMTNESYPNLFDNNKPLLFQLHLQQLANYILAGDTTAALIFTRECLVPLAEGDQELCEQMEQTLVALAFANPKSCPVADVVGDDQRQAVASELNHTIIRYAEGIDSTPVLSKLVALTTWCQDQANANLPPEDRSEHVDGILRHMTHSQQAT
jgi:hypothetical protein